MNRHEGSSIAPIWACRLAAAITVTVAAKPKHPPAANGGGKRGVIIQGVRRGVAAECKQDPARC